MILALFPLRKIFQLLMGNSTVLRGMFAYDSCLRRTGSMKLYEIVFFNLFFRTFWKKLILFAKIFLQKTSTNFQYRGYIERPLTILCACILPWSLSALLFVYRLRKRLWGEYLTDIFDFVCSKTNLPNLRDCFRFFLKSCPGNSQIFDFFDRFFESFKTFLANQLPNLRL